MGHTFRDCAGPQNGPARRLATTHAGHRAFPAHSTNTCRGSRDGDCIGATMNPLTLMLTLTLTAPSLTSKPPTRDLVFAQQIAPRDEWFAEDKLKHMFTSLALVGYGHASARTAGVPSTPSVAIGVSLSAAAGLLKELHDRRRGRPFSARDLAWD